MTPLSMNSNLPEALPHGEIQYLVDDIFFVMGTNVIFHDGIRIQTSRTMTIVREKSELSLVNSIRLDHETLKKLEKLGSIKNVIRLGAFHGRDDAFYQQNYKAQLWALSSMDFSHGEILDHDLANEDLPLKGAKIHEFKTTKFKEALLLLEQANGILLSCDSIKNWQEKDAFFDEKTFAAMAERGALGPAKIDKTWLGAMRPSREEIIALKNLQFSLLISAHGEPLRSHAQEKLQMSIDDALKFL